MRAQCHSLSCSFFFFFADLLFRRRSRGLTCLFRWCSRVLFDMSLMLFSPECIYVYHFLSCFWWRLKQGSRVSSWTVCQSLPLTGNGCTLAALVQGRVGNVSHFWLCPRVLHVAYIGSPPPDASYVIAHTFHFAVRSEFLVFHFPTNHVSHLLSSRPCHVIPRVILNCWFTRSRLGTCSGSVVPILFVWKECRAFAGDPRTTRRLHFCNWRQFLCLEICLLYSSAPVCEGTLLLSRFRTCFCWVCSHFLRVPYFSLLDRIRQGRLDFYVAQVGTCLEQLVMRGALAPAPIFERCVLRCAR